MREINMQEFDNSEKIFLKYLDNPNKEDYDRLENNAFNMNSESSYFFLAYIYYYAKGVKRNISLAKVYLEEVVKKVKVIIQPDERIYKAHEMLGWIYESGDLGKNYFDDAYSLYLEGIKSDNPKFSYERLGFLTYWGYGCEQNYLEAIHYFTEASLRGAILSHYYLGIMCRDGIGAQQSISKAVEHFEIAANGKNEDAISCLAYMYSKNYDEWETNFNKSMSYYEILTRMDSCRAQRMGWYGIGYAYLESNDPNEYDWAISCLNKAAQLGSEQAMELLNSL